MPVALAPNALANLATVKAELGITVTTHDDFLTRAINIASQSIEMYCNRKFSYNAAKVEKVAGFGTQNLIATLTPLKSITSIKFDAALVAATDYSIADANAGFIFRDTGWLWTAASIRGVTYDPYPGSEKAQYELTYAGGYITQPRVDAIPLLTRDLPYDLEDACVRLVSQRYADKGGELGIKSESLMSYSVSYGEDDPSGIPSEVRSILDRYARI